jgi:hypothetical protein
LVALLTGTVLISGLGVSDVWISNSHTDDHYTDRSRGDRPNDFRLEVSFQDMNAAHNHVQNNGQYLYTAEVFGKPHVLSIGQLIQIGGDFKCSIRSEDGAYYGDLEFERFITSYGDRDEEEMEKQLRKDMVDLILKKINQ